MSDRWRKLVNEFFKDEMDGKWSSVKVWRLFSELKKSKNDEIKIKIGDDAETGSNVYIVLRRDGKIHFLVNPRPLGHQYYEFYDSIKRGIHHMFLDYYTENKLIGIWTCERSFTDEELEYGLSFKLNDPRLFDSCFSKCKPDYTSTALVFVSRKVGKLKFWFDNHIDQKSIERYSECNRLMELYKIKFKDYTDEITKSRCNNCMIETIIRLYGNEIDNLTIGNCV